MKITITGSLGNIGSHLTKDLVSKGHSVTVISSNPEKKKDIEVSSAKAAIGSMENADFLTSAFGGANAVYVMEPPVIMGKSLPGCEMLKGFPIVIINSGISGSEPKVSASIFQYVPESARTYFTTCEISKRFSIVAKNTTP